MQHSIIHYIYKITTVVLIVLLFINITSCQYVYEKHIGNEAIHNLWLKSHQEEEEEEKRKKQQHKINPDKQKIISKNQENT